MANLIEDIRRYGNQQINKYAPSINKFYREAGNNFNSNNIFGEVGKYLNSQMDRHNKQAEQLRRFGSKAYNIASSSPAQWALKGYLGKHNFNTSDLTKEELTKLQDISRKIIQNKGNRFKDYTEYASGWGGLRATHDVNKMNLSDPEQGLKYTLGRFSLGRDDYGNVYVRDTYDFAPTKTGDSIAQERGYDSFSDVPTHQQLASIISRYNGKEISPYGALRVFMGGQLPEGTRDEFKMNIGNLGFTPEDIDYLPQITRRLSGYTGKVRR